MMGEMNKRRFWTAYFMDRDISFAIGRPPSMSDHDIDTELPFDIPEETIDDEVVRQASAHVSDIPKIESEIQHIVYRVDQPDCQLLLYIMTERYPSARKYRDVFERIKTAVLSVIAQGKHGPHNPVNLDSNAQAGFESLQAQVGPAIGADFSFMVNAMTGNAMVGNAAPSFELSMDPSAANPLVSGYAPQHHPGDVVTLIDYTPRNAVREKSHDYDITEALILESTNDG
ncbi:putative c6 transcription protein [Eutypa lata UCREL1]|uniref:Putative c6 transcription protein n=1 Tax=Eutypa lata (strain UCR-EL1) TaxID=1287681 RepID=M7TCX8_EUTLA|nr:putative c6 transcription protein [Eutypa lata UCREL1]